MQQVEQELRNLKVDEQSVFALQELGKFRLKINKVYIPFESLCLKFECYRLFSDCCITITSKKRILVIKCDCQNDYSFRL